MDVKKQIKRLVRDECACYSPSLNGIKDYCDREHGKDFRCLIFKDERCGYFEKAVVGMNPQLEKLYKADLKAKSTECELTEEDKEDILEKESSVIGKVKVCCKKCKKTFLADNYRQQYCKFCKRVIRRASNRNTKQKERMSAISSPELLVHKG